MNMTSFIQSRLSIKKEKLKELTNWITNSGCRRRNILHLFEEENEEDELDEIVGFGSLSPYRDRPAYSTTVEDSVYVHRDRRGGGVGRLLLDELLALATTHGFHSVIGRIVGGHEASIALHRACGFEQAGVEREVGRKFGRWLDVMVMQRLL